MERENLEKQLFIETVKAGIRNTKKRGIKCDCASPIHGEERKYKCVLLNYLDHEEIQTLCEHYDPLQEDNCRYKNGHKEKRDTERINDIQTTPYKKFLDSFRKKQSIPNEMLIRKRR